MTSSLQLIPGVSSTSSALTAERMRLDVIAQNIANAQTTRGLDGKPYQRQGVVFESALQQAQQGFGSTAQEVGPRISRIQKDTRPGPSVRMPGHQDADKNGMVTLPNVDIHQEMADLIVASRAFDANLAVLKNARLMARQALSIGKR